MIEVVMEEDKYVGFPFQREREREKDRGWRELGNDRRGTCKRQGELSGSVGLILKNKFLCNLTSSNFHFSPTFDLM